MEREYAKRELERFCSFPIGSANAVLEAFAGLPGAIVGRGGGKENFVYVPGKRADRMVLAAHADTVWDEAYGGDKYTCQRLKEKSGVYSGVKRDVGIGADDRAGCAILWCLKESGHSLLVLDGEEHGQRGAHYLRNEFPALAEEIDSHAYVLQLDRRGKEDYKTYDLPVTDEFKRFVEENTGFRDAGNLARTDIVVLCKKICGANLSVGYYDEHSSHETLVFDDWFRTLTLVEKMIGGRQKRYPLKG